MSFPLLTICVPTYNRARYLDTLLSFVRANILENPSYHVELIVVNNCSEDNTVEIAARYAHPKLTLVNIEQHRPTSEENVFHSIELCQGEYVWFLGDDDIPVIANFAGHYQLLESGEFDFLLFNPAIIDHRGNLDILQNIKMNARLLRMPMTSLVTSIGCLFTLAGISNQIIRRRILLKRRGLHYMACSHIYSMVAWIIDAAKGSPVALINAPLVYYRENDYSGHWGKIAAKMNVCDHHFWGVGLVDLFVELIRNDCITFEQIGRIVEVTRDGGRFNLVDAMIYKLYEQIIQWLETREKRQRISPHQMERAMRFLLSSDATCHDMVDTLRELYSAQNWSDAVRRGQTRFLTLHGQRQGAGRFARRVESVCFGFEIIRTEFAYVAVKQGTREMCEEVLSYIDPYTHRPFVFVEPTLPALLERLETETRSEGFEELCLSAWQRAPSDRLLFVNQATRVDEVTRQLNAVYNSTSWRLTTPIRTVRRVMQKGARLIKGRMRRD